MGDEHLDTILETESDDVIKSSVEDLVPILKDNVKIYSNPLFEFDDEYISSDVNPLFGEVLENIESKDSYDSNLDELHLLVTPLSDVNEDECFNPGGDVYKINDFEDGYYDSEGGILYFESLLSDDTTPNLPSGVFLDHDLRSLSDEPNINDLVTKDKVFDPGIHDQTFSPTYLSLPFKDHHYIFFTYCPVFYDDDDEYSIQYREYLENSSNAITPDLPTQEPDNSLSMGDEHLDTILETELDDVIKSSVEDLVPILNFNDNCTSCDDFSPINIFVEKAVTFSNPIFNSNDDFTSSDDKSISDEDVPEDNVKIYSNPLFEFDDKYISSDVNPLFDEVLENIESKDSYDSNLDELRLLVTPLSDVNEDECFNPRGDVYKINDFEDGYYDSEGDILYFESLLSDDTTPNLPSGVFLDHDLRTLTSFNQ
nr:hypothetical protein [Tanacetum cinerariifolium]